MSRPPGSRSGARLQGRPVGYLSLLGVRPVLVAAVRVYPPNQTQSRVAPYPFSACSKSGPIYLRIGPMQSGT